MRERGFTLVEIALVLVIIGLLLSGGLMAGAKIAGDSKQKAAEQRIAYVEEALNVYLAQNGCLPCPANGALATSAANAGRALNTGGTYSGCTSTACIDDNGVVPWYTLGLAEDDITDPWGNRLRYVAAGIGAVGGTNAQVCTTGALATGSLAQTNGMTRSGSCYPQGNLRVSQLTPTALASTCPIAQGVPNVSASCNAAYVLISNGPDGSFGLTAGTGTTKGDRYGQSGGGGAQDENQNNDGVFAIGPSNTIDTNAHFDDIVVFRTASMLIQKCGSNTAATCGNPE